MNITQIKSQLFSIQKDNFVSVCLAIFQYQAQENPIYKQYLNLLRIIPTQIHRVEDIPFLPIQFFKTHAVISQPSEKKLPLLHFESSATTGQQVSKHYIVDELVYQKSFISNFKNSIGNPEQFCILGLLPSYLERGHSSLVYMVNHLIEKSEYPDSGFYLYNHEELHQKLLHLEQKNQKSILIGTTHALLDFAEKFPMHLFHTKIIETGGMKGRREELSRSEVHSRLIRAFELPSIYSEYGMTELLSQAYSLHDGIYNCPSWMRVYVRELNDPLNTSRMGRGAINIIDLANIHSCAFIATEDTGEVFPDGKFEIFGRLQSSEWRGCSLMTI